MNGRRGDSKPEAGTHEDAVKKMSSGRSSQTSTSQWTPVCTKDVRDLVRVGDNGRRAERQHQARELGRKQL